MEFTVARQEFYSRGELLLRTIFGLFYITIPHVFLLFFVSIWSAILGFIAFWVVLFTGKYPQSMFEFQVKVMRWGQRLAATMHNLVDGYPAFGLEGTSDKVRFEVEYPEQLSRGLVLVRLFFGIFYVLIPHYFCIYFRLIASGLLAFLSWWVVLFTGTYPVGWHEFNVGTLRWMARVQLYMKLCTDRYPSFSGKE